MNGRDKMSAFIRLMQDWQEIRKEAVRDSELSCNLPDDFFTRQDAGLLRFNGGKPSHMPKGGFFI